MTMSHLSPTVAPSLCASFGAFFVSFSACPQELDGVAHQFLQRHDVPCDFVLKVGLDNSGQAAVCEDGRAWALFWMENEIAFVQQQTTEHYKWGSPDLSAPSRTLSHSRIKKRICPVFWEPYRALMQGEKAALTTAPQKVGSSPISPEVTGMARSSVCSLAVCGRPTGSNGV